MRAFAEYALCRFWIDGNGTYITNDFFIFSTIYVSAGCMPEGAALVFLFSLPLKLDFEKEGFLAPNPPPQRRARTKNIESLPMQ